MSHRFKAGLEREPDGGCSVYVPALPGCASQGDTMEEAMANIREAVALYLWSLKDDGLPVPEADPELVIKEIEVVTE